MLRRFLLAGSITWAHFETRYTRWNLTISNEFICRKCDLCHFRREHRVSEWERKRQGDIRKLKGPDCFVVRACYDDVDVDFHLNLNLICAFSWRLLEKRRQFCNPVFAIEMILLSKHRHREWGGDPFGLVLDNCASPLRKWHLSSIICRVHNRWQFGMLTASMRMNCKMLIWWSLNCWFVCGILSCRACCRTLQLQFQIR